ALRSARQAQHWTGASGRLSRGGPTQAHDAGATEGFSLEENDLGQCQRLFGVHYPASRTAAQGIRAATGSAACRTGAATVRPSSFSVRSEMQIMLSHVRN
ncbi:unnamed protein product, partial [Symbiodinium necroappetens]